MKDVILIFTKEGVYNNVLGARAPLPLIYISAPLVKNGFNVKIIDARVDPDWRSNLKNALKNNPLCVGLSSMTGTQIQTSLEASRFIKENSNTKIVWGGVHPTLFPVETLKNDFVDIVVRGNGEETFLELVKALESNSHLSKVRGLSFKKNGKIVQTLPREPYNLNNLPDIPWNLVDLNKYKNRSFHNDGVLNVETSRGCPYACTFCYCTVFHNRSWKAMSPEKTVSLLKELNHKYNVKSFEPIDDNFFVDIKRSSEVMKKILEENLDITMGFQGVRIDSLDRMSQNDLKLLEDAGTVMLQIGVESGSNRILEIIDKRITRDDCIRVNKKLADFKKLVPFYNFMCGFPTETKKDLFDSTSLAWNLLKDNKNAIISPFHIYKPYPGTKMFEMAKNQGFKEPQSLEEWAKMDWTTQTAFNFPGNLSKLFKAVSIVSIGIDKKVEAQSNSKFLRMLSKLYRPYARFRFKNNFYSFMPEKFFLKV